MHSRPVVKMRKKRRVAAATAPVSVASDAVVTIGDLSFDVESTFVLPSAQPKVLTQDPTVFSQFSVSPLFTATSFVSAFASASQATASPSSTSSSSHHVSGGLVGGLIAALAVVLAFLVFLLLRSRQKPIDDIAPPPAMQQTSFARRSDLVKSFPLPPSVDDGASSHYPESIYAPSKSTKRSRGGGDRRSVVSWFSMSRSRLWRRTSVASHKFEWYRSGLANDGAALTRNMSFQDHVPPAELFERDSPLAELSERAAMKLFKPAAEKNHMSLSHDLEDSASVTEKVMR